MNQQLVLGLWILFQTVLAIRETAKPKFQMVAPNVRYGSYTLLILVGIILWYSVLTVRN